MYQQYLVTRMLLQATVFLGGETITSFIFLYCFVYISVNIHWRHL